MSSTPRRSNSRLSDLFSMDHEASAVLQGFRGLHPNADPCRVDE